MSVSEGLLFLAWRRSGSSWRSEIGSSRSAIPTGSTSPRGETKLDLARYYLSVADGIVNALYHRPCMLHRFPDGVDGEKVHQKRLPHGAPPWIETVRVHFPRFNRDADELCVTHPADVIWAVQMSTVEFHPWNSRREDVESPTSGGSILTRCQWPATPTYGGSQ